MSKKLIAVAAAAALALTGLVGVAPANAALVTNFFTQGASADTDVNATVYGSTAAATLGSAVIDVPANNVIEYTSTSARKSLMKVTVTTVIGDSVGVTAVGGAKIVETVLNASLEAQNSTAGAATYSKTATTTATSFFVFTTATSVQSLTITKGGNTGVYYFKAAAGPAYNLTATMPAVIPAAAPSTPNLIAKITDVFGNTVKGTQTLTATASGATPTITPSTSGSVTYNDTLGGFGFTLSAAGTGGLGVEIFISTAPTRPTGLAAPASRWFGSSSAADLAGQVTALTAQVATLTAQLAGARTKANSVTKKRWNKLVRAHRALGGSAKLK